MEIYPVVPFLFCLPHIFEGVLQLAWPKMFLRSLSRSLAHIPPPSGRLDLIIGCMYSGKTTELIRQVTKHEAAGRRCLVVNSAKDVRYPGQEDGGGGETRARIPRAGLAVTHTGVSAPAIAAPTLASVMLNAGDSGGAYEAYAGAGIVAVDEAHFFPDLYGLRERCIFYFIFLVDLFFPLNTLSSSH